MSDIPSTRNDRAAASALVDDVVASLQVGFGSHIVGGPDLPADWMKERFEVVKAGLCQTLRFAPL